MNIEGVEVVTPIEVEPTQPTSVRLAAVGIAVVQLATALEIDLPEIGNLTDDFLTVETQGQPSSWPLPGGVIVQPYGCIDFTLEPPTISGAKASLYVIHLERGDDDWWFEDFINPVRRLQDRLQDLYQVARIGSH